MTLSVLQYFAGVRFGVRFLRQAGNTGLQIGQREMVASGAREGFWKIISEMTAAAFFALQGGKSNKLRGKHHVRERREPLRGALKFHQFTQCTHEAVF